MGTRFENLNVAGLTTVGIKMNLKDMESENDIPDIITYLLGFVEQIGEEFQTYEPERLLCKGATMMATTSCCPLMWRHLLCASVWRSRASCSWSRSRLLLSSLTSRWVALSWSENFKYPDLKDLARQTELGPPQAPNTRAEFYGSRCHVYMSTFHPYSDQ